MSRQLPGLSLSLSTSFLESTISDDMIYVVHRHKMIHNRIFSRQGHGKKQLLFVFVHLSQEDIRGPDKKR